MSVGLKYTVYLLLHNATYLYGNYGDGKMRFNGRK